ncbi:MAG: sigma-70 family RNA polymerase sigma factor [Candidatus Delongbacteria bacterium]
MRKIRADRGDEDRQATKSDKLLGKGRALSDRAEHERVFRQLAADLEPELLRIGRGLLGDWDEALDASQQTLLTLWQHLPALDTSAPLRPWVLRVHVNRCRSLLRRRRVRRWLRLEDLPEVPAPPPANEHDLPEVEDLLRLARGLSRRQREAWLLCDLEELDSAVAGAALGCRPETVRVHLMRARARLRAGWLKEQEERP